MNNKQKEFIALRADGLSFDKIKEELKTSKSTLIQWSRLFRDEIRELEILSFESIRDEFCYSQKEKYKMLLIHINNIDKVIEKSNYNNVSVKDLFSIRNTIMIQMKKMETNILEVDSELKGLK